MSEREFDGRVALVVGGGSGIGAATAHAFARAGARVVVADLRLPAAEAVAAELTGSGGRGVALDVADDVQGRAVVDDVLAREGRLDHLVHCAADFSLVGPDATRAAWDRALGVNVVGPSMLTAYAAPRMPGGTVVHVASISAHVAQPGRWAYNASKAAILALTRAQALDFRGYGVRVNAVSPGWVWTPEVDKAAAGDRAAWEPVWGAYHVLERLGEPSEIADAVLYLSSPRASFVTGTELLVDGGYRAIGSEGLGGSARFAGSGSE